MKLSKAQEKMLDKMEAGIEYSAYDLQCSLPTLRSLRDKGLITSRTGVGSFTFPRNGIMWKIKEENETNPVSKST